MKLPNHAVKYTLAVLLLATLTTTQILSTSYAKYTTTSNNITDSARVAKYDVALNRLTESVALDVSEKPEATLTYKVTNNSEVAIKISKIKVYSTQQLPKGTTLTIYGKDDTLIKEQLSNLKEEKTRYVATLINPSTLTCIAPGDSAMFYIVLKTTQMDLSSGIVSSLEGFNMHVRITAVQID